MVQSVISGIVLGCVLSLLVGPVFFMILNTSIKKGFLPASMLAFGVLLSDCFFVALTYFGSSLLFVMSSYEVWIGISGGVLILSFGLVTYFKKATIHADALEIADDSKTRAAGVVKGFMMNTLNPSALLFWLGVAGTLSLRENIKGFQAFLFYSGTLGTVFTSDLVKAWVASRLKHMIRTRSLILMNRVSGLALIAFGIYMLGRTFMEMTH